MRISDRPPDIDHHYGHGKVGNISALFETLLLFLTCGWITYEALYRIISNEINLKINFWSFMVMVVSIIVDLSRSRALYSVANKFRSQALEADALHFRTDIWNPVMVIIGLISVIISRNFPSLLFLRYADSVSAIVVVSIVVYIGLKLIVRTIGSLIDEAPKGLRKKIIRLVEELPGVANCHDVRLRYSGSKLFIDIHVFVDGNQSLKNAHFLMEKIENAIGKFVPNADILIHPEPIPDGDESSI